VTAGDVGRVNSPILERSHLKLRPLKLTMPIPQWRTSPAPGGAFLCKYRGPHSRRQLLAKEEIAASRVASYPCVGVRSSWCPKANVHTQGEPTGAALALKMRPTTMPSARRNHRRSTRQTAGLLMRALG
jgi:hypothetical protein